MGWPVLNLYGSASTRYLSSGLRVSFLTALMVAASLVLVLRPGVLQAETAVRSILEQRRHNVVLQQYDLSCGAAALATILNYQHGKNLDERQVAIGLISRDIYIANPAVLRIRQGFSLLDMKRYVEQLGYQGEALGKIDFEYLSAHAPAIVPVSLYGFSHFVVFRGTLGMNVLVADPAFGNRTLSVERFIDAWIDYGDFGKVAFSVARRDGLIPPNRLSVAEADFPMLMQE